MPYLIAVLCLFSSLSASAQGSRHPPFERLEHLTRKYPEAFQSYARHRFLVPTGAAVLDRNHDVSRIHIFPVSMPKAIIKSRFDRPEPTRLILSETEISPRMPPEFGWKILLAELLLKFPQTRRIDYKSSSLDGAPYAGFCADQLAKGKLDGSALAASPTHRALAAFGFELISLTFGSNEYLPAEPTWLDELVITASYARP